MAFKCFVEDKLGKFPQFLIYAILELIIIVLLYVDGFLAFVSNELAKFFELSIPCLLCTRIDHVLVNRSKDFYYNDSICEDHKKDISSLAYCHVHRRLSDIRNMCVGCLLSFATEKDSDCDKYKSLMGILHKDIDCFIEDDQRINTRPGKKDDGAQVDKNGGGERCSCCGEPLKTRPLSKFSRSPSMNGPTPSPRAPSLPQFRYTELKLVSDNGSELLRGEEFSTGDQQSKEDTKATSAPLLADSEDLNEDALRTPTFSRGNRFFGIPLSDSTQASPRWRTSRKLPFERAELVLDPTEANAIVEGDGDSIVHQLKKQVRLDRKSLIELYMELDEERSASAIAANNAMAMITRLQAEKAAVQMEALQYQRMMEEQAEYDEEAIQLMKDLLLKKDEDIKVLESELEAYQEKYGPIKKDGSEVYEDDGYEDYQEMKSHSVSSFSEKSDLGSPKEAEQIGEKKNDSECARECEGGSVDESSLDLESERIYLHGLLKDLEHNITKPSAEGSLSSESDTNKHENGDKGNVTNASLSRELSLIRERLRAMEVESDFLKHAAIALQKGDEGAKLLTEIAQHLRNLRHSVKMRPEEAGFVLIGS